MQTQQKKTHIICSEKGSFEQDPREWWKVITLGVEKVLAQIPHLKKDIYTIACTAQWSGTVPIDKTGKALMNAITWMDSRGAPHIKKIASGTFKIQGYSIRKLRNWIKKTGGAPSLSGKDSLAHILYIKNEKPEIYAKTYKFLEPKDYINFLLTGEIASSYDTMSLHWLTNNQDINNIFYDQKLLNLCKIDREKLPDLKNATCVLGELKANLAEQWGLQKKLKIVVGSPDILSANIGSGAIKNYESYLYVGTSSWLTCHVPFKKTDLFSNMATLPAAIKGRYFIANEQESAGACINYIKDQFWGNFEKSFSNSKRNLTYKYIEELASKSPSGSKTYSLHHGLTEKEHLLIITMFVEVFIIFLLIILLQILQELLMKVLPIIQSGFYNQSKNLLAEKYLVLISLEEELVLLFGVRYMQIFYKYLSEKLKTLEKLMLLDQHGFLLSD